MHGVLSLILWTHELNWETASAVPITIIKSQPPSSNLRLELGSSRASFVSSSGMSSTLSKASKKLFGKASPKNVMSGFTGP